jgi:hypothetical protein
MKKDTEKILLYGGLAVGAYLLFTGSPVLANIISPGAATAAALPVSTYPYLISGAPAIPSAFDKTYYLTYIRPAMVAVNGNVNNPGYTLSATDCANYLANYTDLQTWVKLPATIAATWSGHTVNGALIWHWHTYGVANQRTFLPLPWNDPTAFVPAPVSPKSSGGSGFFSTILKVATITTGAVLEVTSAGALTPIVAPATSAALTAESAIHGPGDILTDDEISLIITSAAITKKILPFYLEVAPDLVDSIQNKLDILISEYAS